MTENGRSEEGEVEKWLRATPARSKTLLTGGVARAPTDACRPNSLKHSQRPLPFISSGIGFQESIAATVTT